VALKAHVARVCFNYFRCFRGMLQVFYMDVAKIYWDVAHVAMVVHICHKHLFQIFHLFFRRMLQVCLFGCCIYVSHICSKFYLDVSYVLQ
jgi:hypothetical protein